MHTLSGELFQTCNTKGKFPYDSHPDHMRLLFYMLQPLNSSTIHKYDKFYCCLRAISGEESENYSVSGALHGFSI